MRFFTDEQYEDFKTKLDKAIMEALPSGFLAQGWVAVVEYIGDDGQPSLVRANNEQPSWRVQGLLHTGLYGEWFDGDASG